MKKTWYVIQGHILLRDLKRKKERVPFAATWMDLETIILGEVSQTERQISYDMPYM